MQLSCNLGILPGKSKPAPFRGEILVNLVRIHYLCKLEIMCTYGRKDDYDLQ